VKLGATTSFRHPYLRSLFVVISVLMSLAPVNADTGLRLVTFGAPPKFESYFLSLDGGKGMGEGPGKFNSDGAWVSVREADVIVIFNDTITNADFIPAIFLPVYQQVALPSSKPAYFIPEKAFGGTLSAQVVFVIREEIQAEIDGLPMDNFLTNSSNFLSCYTAGRVISGVLDLGKGVLDLISDCGLIMSDD